MEKKKNLLIALLLIWVAPSFAAKVDTLLIKSPSMNKECKWSLLRRMLHQKEIGGLSYYLFVARLWWKC